MRDANLLCSGALWLAWLLLALATLFALFLAAPLRRLGKALLWALAVGALATTGTWIAMDYVWVPFPDGLDWHVYAWIFLAGTDLVLLGFALVRKGRPAWRATRILGAIVAVALFAVGASLGTNEVYQAYPTLSAFLGRGSIQTVKWTDLHLKPGKGKASAARAIASGHGILTQVRIPGARSGFKARAANIYLPPAALGSNPPKLPVVVMLPGIPGTPNDWVRLGTGPQIAEQYAATHGGVAPILVLADVTRATTFNTLCADSVRGNASTYATKDIPALVKKNLPAADSPQQWMVVGVSFGGTCAVQFALQDPTAYRHFFDMSGEAEQKLFTRAYTIKNAFASNTDQWARYQIEPLLAQRSYPQLSGRFGLGVKDDFSGPKTRRIHALAKKKKIAVGNIVYTSGRHSWAVWRTLLKSQWPWMMQQLELEKEQR